MFERSDEQPSWVGALAPGTRWMRYPFAADVCGLCPVGSPAFDAHAQQALDWAIGVTKQKAPDLIISVAGRFEQRTNDPAREGIGLAGVCGVRANGERMVGLSLDNPGTVLDNVLHHELVHFLRRGYFNASEWSSLVSASERHDWSRQFDIAGRYPTVSADRRVEESIAETFAWWRHAAGGGSQSDRGRARYSRPSDPSRLIIPGRAERLFHDIENGAIGNRSWDADIAARVAVLDAETPSLSVPPPSTGPPDPIHRQFRVGVSPDVPPALLGQAFMHDDGVGRAGGNRMSSQIQEIGGTDLEMAMRVAAMEGAPPLLKAAANLAVRTSFHRTSNHEQAQEIWRTVSALYAGGQSPDAKTVERFSALIERMNQHPQLMSVVTEQPRSFPTAGTAAAGVAGVGLTAAGIGATQSGAFESSLLDSVSALATRGLDAAAVAIGQKPPEFTSDPSAWLQWQLNHVAADDPLADIAAKGGEAANQLWSTTTTGAQEARTWFSEALGQAGDAWDTWRHGPTPPLPFTAPTADTLPLSADALRETDGQVGQFVDNLKLSPPPDGHAMVIERLQELWEQIKDWVAAQFSNNDLGTEFGSLMDQASTALHQVAASDMVQSAMHAVSSIQFSAGQQALVSPGLILETADQNGERSAVPVDSFATASAMVRQATRVSLADGIPAPDKTAIIKDAGGRDVARVSKEGVVWPAAYAPDRPPLYDPKRDPELQKKAAAVMVLISDAIARDDRAKLGGIVRAVDPDMADKFGRTMAHVVAQSGPAWAIDMLAKAGADLNTRTHWGSTPMAYAASGANAAAIVALRSHGADPALADNRGRKPADLTKNESVRSLLDSASAAQYRLPAPGEAIKVGFNLPDSSDQRRRYAELTEKAWHEKPRELSVETGVVRPIVMQKLVSTDTHGLVQGEAVGPVRLAARKANIPVIEDKKRPELGIAVPLDGQNTQRIALLTGREIVVMQHDDDRRHERGRSQAMDRLLDIAKRATPYAAASLGAIGLVAIGTQKLGDVQFRLATAQARDVAQSTLLVGASNLSETVAIRQRASLLADQPITIALTRAEDGLGRLVMGLTFETREAAEKAAEALAIGGYRSRVLAEPNAGAVVHDAQQTFQQASITERSPTARDEVPAALPQEPKLNVQAHVQDDRTASAPQTTGSFVREVEAPVPPAVPGRIVNAGEVLHSGTVHHVGTLDVRVVPAPQGLHTSPDTGGATATGWLRPVDVGRAAVAGAASLLGTAVGHSMFKAEGSEPARTQPVLVEGGRLKIKEAASGLRDFPPDVRNVMAIVTRAYANAPSTPPDMAMKAQNGLQALAMATRPATVAKSRLAGGGDRGGM